MSNPHIDAIRARVRAPQNGAPSLAPSAPPAALGHATGGASNLCGACRGDLDGETKQLEWDGVFRLTFHEGCVPEGPFWVLSDDFARLLGIQYDLSIGREGVWRMDEPA